MVLEKARNSYSAPPALDAPVRFSQDFENMILFDFSQSLESCIAQRNLEITLAETRKEVSMEPPQYNGGLWGLQKREYLAKRKCREGKSKCLYLILKP